MRLNVSFAAPGWFLNDPRLVVTLGDRTLYDGSFRAGFSVSLQVPGGEHVLETAVIVAGSMARRQRYELKLDASGGYRDVSEVHAQLSYSRLTGNFEKRLSVSTRG